MGKREMSEERVDTTDAPVDKDQHIDEGGMGLCGWILIVISYVICICTFPIAIPAGVKIVQEYERAVIFRLGRLRGKKAVGPGIFWVLPCTDEYIPVDLRTVSFDIPPQEILTKDSVTVNVDAVVYYKITVPTASVNNVENSSHSTQLLAQTTFRNILGTRTLAEILSEREAIAGELQTTLDKATDRWGILVERVEVKNVRLPENLQRAMAAEAEATREAKAKMVAAQGEMDASKSLREAAETIAQSSSALQLRYLQTLNSIAAEKNSTVLFPIPMNMLTE